ncbi:MAG: hypothetical protein AUH85_02945 [Chloroflexi bacterium 13_1_40CM_4_68_4]|nr:MAG: hypothetical protein AUH85_02945 [Chloroflexi bacterium 13_1_40CM_4_68_4]
MSEHGLFSPDSVAWMIDRERAVLLGGGRSLLMQLAHPRVARGVAEHSDFRKRPFRRLARTLTLSLDSVFGDRDVALRSAGRINAAHASVRGEGYSAFDPDLLLWVFATLADSAVLSYELFVRDLTSSQKNAYYEETLRATQVLGLRRATAPHDFAGLRDYVRDQIESGVVRVDDTGYAMARATLYPTNAGFVPRPAFDAGAFITAALLPAELRAQFGLPWSLRHQAAFEVFARLVRAGVPLLPSTLRHVPQARAARKRVA